MIKRNKQPSLKTITPSLPSQPQIYTDNLSGESNTCCHCPAGTTRAPESNYLLIINTNFYKSNEPPSIYGGEKVCMDHLLLQEDLTGEAKTFSWTIVQQNRVMHNTASIALNFWNF